MRKNKNLQRELTILEKVYLAAKARLAAKAAKEAILRKGALEGSSLPGKLAGTRTARRQITFLQRTREGTPTKRHH